MSVSRSRSAWSALVDTLIAAAGLGLLAMGLRSWATLTWQADTSASRSPLTYLSQVDLRESKAALAPYDWVVLARGPSAARACRDLRSTVTDDGVPIPAVLVLAIDSGRADAYFCDSGAASRSVALEARAIPAPLPQGGFVLLDSSRRVTSGSYLMRDLEDLPAVLRLLSPPPRAAEARE